jgi:hypothetical protein
MQLPKSNLCTGKRLTAVIEALMLLEKKKIRSTLSPKVLSSCLLKYLLKCLFFQVNTGKGSLFHGILRFCCIPVALISTDIFV